jgi:plastocyanin
VADPEQIYQEVLTEEQGKGVSPAVAEGRAKAARARAEQGSPHPKEPKWWPGAQPHLESGDGSAPAAEAEPVAEEVPAEEPAAPEPEPAPAPAAAAEPAEEPPTEEVAVQPSEPAVTRAQPAEQPAPAAAAAAATPARPAGVTHGSATGTRVRPEDSVTTEAQFQGQTAMYERRKLIDELIATGVPATAAAEAGERRSPMLAILYLLIPLLAIGIVVAQNDASGGGEGNGAAPAPPDTGAITITAANVAFDTDEITLPADEETTVTFVNDDSVVHNFSVYEDDSAQEAIFQGQNVDGGGQIDNDIPALEAGEYFFRCDLHPTSMIGTLVAE